MTDHTIKQAREEHKQLSGKQLVLMDDVELHKVVMILYQEYCNQPVNAEDWLESVMQKRINELEDLEESRA